MKNQIQNKNQILHKWLHLFAKTFNFAVCSVIFFGATLMQVKGQCPSPTATTAPITTGVVAASSTTTAAGSGSVTYVNGSVTFGSPALAYTITISTGTTWVISAGSHLQVSNLNVGGTLIIQDGASVSVSLTTGGSLSISGSLVMCSNSAIENCGTTTIAQTSSVTYVGASTAKAVMKFSNAPGYGGSLSMPQVPSSLTNSSNIWLATYPSGSNGGLWNVTGLKGSASSCTIGSNCTGLPYTVSSACGEFYGQTAVGTCTAGTTAPTLSATTKANTCPTTTVDLTTITATNLPSGTTLTWHTGTPATTANKVTGTAVAAGTYYAAFFDATNNCYSGTAGSATTAVTATVTACVTPAAGTIDCAKTQIFTAPVFGQAGQKTLVVTVNVTTPGCFSPITVSGSGMTLANGATQVCTTTTGVQNFSIPVNYDGTTLGTTNFTVGAAGSCSADLTQTPKKAISEVWTLDCVPTAGPSLK